MTDPRPTPYPTQPAPSGSSSFGVAAFWVAIVVAALSVVSQLLTRFLPFTGDLDIAALGVVFAVLSVVSGLAGAVALILGVVAARRPGDRPVFAGIGIGVGGLALLSTLLGFASGLASYAFTI